ncbi:hypothetical protein COX26_02190 [Candidatus Jorgensenbacteria bacterium CG23_combo_of_CG06-09_8_20_14_all_54_14]|uniref:Uncharacterized protein n=1 Tax=Candidatus Jorgensenbacteria bacterium CG23_combo_of_CG06-09_8_20_14_all_54_14 TaxID=1974595 RepID=A0A2G9Z9K4_9BACT|nr:MAG: hypothetical protein COX26_02190 [Candidatus Jorgensenbacteria bacterium CG23_combo_of_CG06-09_8_20_14_all_54_14]
MDTSTQTSGSTGAKKTWWVVAALVIVVLAAAAWWFSSGNSTTDEFLGDTSSAIDSQLQSVNIGDLDSEFLEIDASVDAL